MTSGGSETVGRFLTIVLSVATARALAPEEVGILGIAVILVGLISMVASYVETAAVVSPGAEDEQYSLAALCARAVLTLLLVAALVLALPALSERLVGADGSRGDLQGLVLALAWQPILEGLGAYPRVLLQRRLDLVILALANLLQAVVHVGLAVALLWSGFGATGVVYGALAGTTVASAVAWLRWLSHESPGWPSPSRETLRSFAANFSRVFANGFFTYVNAQVDKVLVAGTLGPAAMSYYGMAWNASRFPGGVLAQSLRFSLVPAVARMQHDARAVERALVEALRHSIFLAMPIAAGLFVAAPSLVLVVLGERWLPVVPALRVMSVAVVAAPVLEGASTLLIGMGKAHLTAVGSMLTVLALLALTPWCAIHWGVIGAAYANLASVIVLDVSLVLTAWLAFPEIRWLRGSIVLMPLAAVAVAGLFAHWLGSYREPGIVRLLVEGTTLLVLYPVGVSLGGGRETIGDLLLLIRRSLQSAKALPRSAS